MFPDVAANGNSINADELLSRSDGVHNREKIPAIAWKLFHDWCPSSGGLVVRDFDDRGTFDRWRSRFPIEVRTLPTVETARGGNVYRRTDPKAFLRLTGGRRSIDPP